MVFIFIAQGKIFGIKAQPVVKSVYIQAPMNYFLNIQCHDLISVGISTKETTTSRLKSMNNTKKKGERTCLGTGTNMWRC
jgi:hypothetical protein